jgi:formate dehydrogenase major subunit
MAESAGREALAAIDRLLADRPDKIGHDFSAAVRHLAMWRDTLARRPRENDPRALGKLNAALSVILGGQFPLGQIPWPEIERLRNDLSDLVDTAADQPPAAGSSSHTTRS